MIRPVRTDWQLGGTQGFREPKGREGDWIKKEQ